MNYSKAFKFIGSICLLIISIAGKGQNFYLYNVKTSKTRTISSLKNIRVQTEERKVLKLKGEAMMVNDSVVAINDTLVHINDIIIIQAVTNKSVQNGIILSVVSAGLITLGTVFAIQSGSAEGIGALVKGLLSYVTYLSATGYIFNSIKSFFWGNHYKTDEGWTLKMIYDTPIIIPSGKLP